MRIVVLVKSAVDEALLKTDSAGRPILKGAAMKLSNFDANGVEEALRLKDELGGTVTLLTLGEDRGAIKEALAMGASEATRIVPDPDSPPDAPTTAYSLAKAVERLGGVDLVICSEGASDTYQGQVGAMVAEFMRLPFLPYAKNVEVTRGRVRCEQAFEAGVRVLETGLPAVVSMSSGSNKPRYPTILQVMAAAKKKVDEVPISSLQGSDAPQTHFKVLGVKAQVGERRREILEGTPEAVTVKLIEVLRREGII